MTYFDLIRSAEYKLDKGYITLGEYEKMIEPLKREIQPERKAGRWVNIDESEKWECSECGRMMWFSQRLGVKPSDYSFCPNCGADMREEHERSD